ncbi:MAG: RHS repeat-associated core domain-containing protein [Acidobacteriota bacterium]
MSRTPSPLRMSIALGAVCALVAVWPSSASAQVCAGPVAWSAEPPVNDSAPRCLNFIYCNEPELEGPTIEVEDGCDPAAGPCTIFGVVGVVAVGNHLNSPSNFPGSSPLRLEWRDSSGSFVGSCGNPGGAIFDERGDGTISRSFQCGDAGGGEVYELTARVCAGASSCTETATVDIDLTDGAAARALCPRPPVETDCSDEEDCESCLGGGTGGGGPGAAPGGGAGASGGGPWGGGGGTGPGAVLRYRADGPVQSSMPGGVTWSPGLGRFWSHSYAQRLVDDTSVAAPAARVWLITGSAVYRRFDDADGDGVFESVTPTSVYRALETVVGGGWTLTDLDGTVTTFDATGRWLATADRNGNSTSASYADARLDLVTFPDGRSEDFAYDAGGMLESITEIGVDGSTTRTWTYTWSGVDLARIDRPDGTALEYFYDDPGNPGWMTRVDLVGADGTSRRVVRAWEHDALGNVTHMWRGAIDFASGVDRWQIAHDDPLLPRVTTVTDPLGVVSTYTWDTDRQSVNEKAKLVRLEGDCPACAVAPNAQRFFVDAANPFRVTREIDGRGLETHWTYDANGRPTARIEAFGTPRERTTEWTYDPAFPAFVDSIRRESVEGFPSERVESSIFDAVGDRTSSTIAGVEDGQAFAHTTTYGYNAGGSLETIDRPGLGTDDVVTFTYDPTRGNGLLVRDSRIDPLVGATAYGHDAFNRRISVTDPNGVVTETEYDALDRVRFVRERGATPAEDLVTEWRYTTFGDLFQIVLPRGNAIEHAYDAAGRLVSIERKADDQASTRGERVVFTLNGFGQRTVEERQSWDGAAWITDARTESVYSTRCHVDRTIEGLPGEEQSVTEYGYDCNGNLDRIWDANHPNDGTTAPTTESVYDELDRLVTVRQPWGGAGGGTLETSYDYDVQDHLVEIVDGEGTVTSFVYSDRDLMTDEVSEVSGTTTYAYDQRGLLTTRTDARGVVETRAHDALDRPTLVDYPDDTLDIVYTYDDPAVPFSTGRLTSIARDGESVDFRSDRFGRRLQEGPLVYAYDANGNRTSIEYPGGVITSSTYDFADRQSTLDVTLPDSTIVPIVSASRYASHGPLVELALGNDLVETRAFDARYFPDSITVTGTTTLLDWDYTTDALGNPTAIDDVVAPGASRSFAYQDVQYFLTTGDGPWGDLSWTYDRAGNRLSETRGSTTDAYRYLPNAAVTGNTGRLDQVQLGLGGLRTFTYDAAGHQARVDSAGAIVDRAYDDDGRLASLSLPATESSSSFRYDARGFLRQATTTAPAAPGTGVFCDGFESGDTSAWGGSGSTCFETTAIEPVYSDAGLLHSPDARGAPASTRAVLMFGGRPVAQVEGSSAGGMSVRWLTTDHLGTPILLTDENGATLWTGGFEPFGRDFAGAAAAGVLLRLPGQWADQSWTALETDLAFNVHRWYQPNLGLYTRPDPIVWNALGHHYLYVLGRPTSLIDPLGLFPEDRTADRADALARDLRDDLDCIQAVRDEVRATGTGHTRYQHCMGNCLITKRCKTGRAGAVAASLAKEFGDVYRCVVQRQAGNCNSAFQPKDFEDNERGRDCPRDQSCEDRCKSLLEAREPPAGPFGPLAPPEN